MIRALAMAGLLVLSACGGGGGHGEICKCPDLGGLWVSVLPAIQAELVSISVSGTGCPSETLSLAQCEPSADAGTPCDFQIALSSDAQTGSTCEVTAHLQDGSVLQKTSIISVSTGSCCGGEISAPAITLGQ